MATLVNVVVVALACSNSLWCFRDNFLASLALLLAETNNNLIISCYPGIPSLPFILFYTSFLPSEHLLLFYFLPSKYTKICHFVSSFACCFVLRFLSYFNYFRCGLVDQRFSFYCTTCDYHFIMCSSRNSSLAYVHWCWRNAFRIQSKYSIVSCSSIGYVPLRLLH